MNLNNSIYKVVLFGPQNTGKTKLCIALAKHYNVSFVPEFARLYAEQNKNLSKETVLPIAKGQLELEDKYLQNADKLLFFDTNLLETHLYSKLYYNYVLSDLVKLLEKRTYNLYFLPYIDVPWEDDSIRDLPNNRLSHYNFFKNELVKRSLNFIELKGSFEERLETAIKNINKSLKKVNFNTKDIALIESKGLQISDVEKQLHVFKNGLSYINLNAAATLKNGINSYNEKQTKYYVDLFEAKRNSIEIVKFVPASGAATRMFKFLFSFLEVYKNKKQSINAYINTFGEVQLSVFMVGFEKLPFYQQVVEAILKEHKEYHILSINDKVVLFITYMLNENFLNFGFYPKGLIPFHLYKDHIATAFEEHLFEAALYASSKNKANLHFTISEKHKNQFNKEFKNIQTIVEGKTRTTFNITFSYQEEKTDTIAVDTKSKPFRDENNELHFRPSGHGALLQNLNKINADIAFIKNIDNVVVYKYEKEISYYKKLLAGVLIEKQQKTFDYLKIIDQDLINDSTIVEIKLFLEKELNTYLSPLFNKFSKESKIEALKEKLNRPLRVCGMVKNEGEPGGGPFWVNGLDNTKSLQIVESAQINHEDLLQNKILKNATHFNPVDIVCGLKNYKNQAFDLNNFVDHDTAFITNKTRFGKKIKALELPGLWNGSMAKWNTIFVEVPLITFNPVKTVNDLLKPAHQV